jgi:hypothetical protein
VGSGTQRPGNILDLVGMRLLRYYVAHRKAGCGTCSIAVQARRAMASGTPDLTSLVPCSVLALMSMPIALGSALPFQEYFSI